MPENLQELLDKYKGELLASLQPTKETPVKVQGEVDYYEGEGRKNQNERYRSDTQDRKWLAEWTATVVSFWLLLVLAILMSNNSFGLSDSVLITLLGTTTLNVLGLSFIVLRGHFKG